MESAAACGGVDGRAAADGQPQRTVSFAVLGSSGWCPWRQIDVFGPGWVFVWSPLGVMWPKAGIMQNSDMWASGMVGRWEGQRGGLRLRI